MAGEEEGGGREGREGREGIEEEEAKARTERRVKKAAQLLFFRQHRVPGVKGWELRKALGEDYLEVLSVLNSALDRFGMGVKRISEDTEKSSSEGEEGGKEEEEEEEEEKEGGGRGEEKGGGGEKAEAGKGGEEVKEREGDRAARDRFVIVLKDPVIEKASGERIDELAMLAATLVYIISKQGKAPRRAVEDLLADKFPKQRVLLALDRFIRQGYLGEDNGILYIGWRTRAEVDRRSLVEFVLQS